MNIRLERGVPAWSASAEDVLQNLAVDADSGLRESEVLERRRRHGRNLLEQARRKPLLSILVAQFRSIVVVLLMGAGVLALLFSNMAEAVAIFVVILINAAIGFLTEWRAVRSMEALRRFARVECVVMREGTLRQVPAEELVPGDIVELGAGDLVPADLRLLGALKLKVNESTLTGESLPVDKHSNALAEDTRILERHNMAFKGSAITRGSARGVVVATGMHTELGRIFAQVSEAQAQQTPLEKRLDSLGERLAWATIAIGVLVAITGIVAGRDTVLAIEVAIALAVAAIPEGLPIVATIALARGMWRMARRGALITRLSAVETLGATSVILTDKTGTLTENRMVLTTVLLADGELEFDGPGQDACAGLLRKLLTAATLCNNATLENPGDAASTTIGEPTEVALLEASAKLGLARPELVRQAPEVHEEVFDSDTRRMATVHQCDGAFTVAVKGAPEVVFAACDRVCTREGEVALDEQQLRHWLERVDRLGARGLRTLALAEKRVSSSDAECYSDLVLLGVVGLEDPAREGIEGAIKRCREAGVVVIMVTGDHAGTAGNIARQTGVIGADAGDEQFLGGNDVARLLEQGRKDRLLAARVFSRVTPEQKLNLISLFQQSGHVVAMTGDGVNDAPALKKADIGIAMGQRGTAVAKEAAAMVLQDDDFETIVEAVRLGRSIFENIRKFAVYLLSCNFSELLVISLATVVGAPLPLLPLQILFLNLVTDVFPALALGVGPERESLMNRAPRPATERILMRRHWLEIGLHGLVMALVVLAAMWVSSRFLGFTQQQTLAVTFCTLAFAQLWHVFNMRGNLRRVWRNEITRNPWVWAALLLCVVLTLAAVYTPALSKVMELSAPGRTGWLVIIVASVMPLFAAPLVKAVARRL
jgi:Ca2+-transporting ATPase